MAETNQCGGSQVDGKLLGTGNRRVFPIGVAGVEGLTLSSPMGGGILLKKHVFWGLTLFF